MATYVAPEDCIAAAESPQAGSRQLTDDFELRLRSVLPTGPAVAAATGDDPMPVAGAVGTRQGKRLAIAVFAWALVATGCWVISATFGWENGAAPARPPADGLTIFAVFFVGALAVERLLEPMANAILPKAEKIKTAHIQLKNAGRAIKQSEPGAAQALQAAANAEEDLSVRQFLRTTFFWALATVLGMLAAATMKLDFLGAVGITGSASWQAILATGLIIGAGTKPLHELVTLITKKTAAAS